MRVAVLLLAVVLFSPLGAQQPPVRREGAYWVQTVQGTVPSSGSVVRVHTRGPLVVRGAATAQGIRYILRKRVRSSNEAEARRLLGELRLTTQPGSVRLDSPERPRAGAELELVVPAQTSQTLLETHSGDVSVSDVRGKVEVKSGAGLIQIDRVGGTVSARTAGGDIRLGQIGGAVNCFSGGGTISVDSTGGESWLETAGGEIHVGRSAGPVHASTAGGNIQIGKANASVQARTAGGRIEVAEARGIVVAGNSGGSIQVGAAGGVRLEATGGSIRLRGSSGALRAMSDVGNILAELISGVRLQDSVLSTGAGDITVYIPSDIAVTIQALNEGGRSGRIVSEFSEVPVRFSRGETRSVVLAEGALNGGGPVLKLTSTDGTIYLRRTRQ